MKPSTTNKSTVVAADTHMNLVVTEPRVIELTVERNASCNIYVMLQENTRGEVILQSQVQRDAQLMLFEVGIDQTELSCEHDIVLAEDGARFAYFGLDQLCGIEKKNARLTVTHRAPRTTSSQWFRGVYGGNSLGSFVGNVVVEKDARESHAQQLYKAIIVGDKAKAHVKPELAIFNHDISASHGATIGELDQDALFYLCTRGISREDAQTLLLEGFVNEVVQHIPSPEIKAAIEQASRAATMRMLREAV